jgi:hypothetical protein
MTPASTTTLTCADGANFDLLNPRPEHVSFPVIWEHLAKAKRYCGATPGVEYSVAQHSVLCAQAALFGTGSREIAAYLLCHDMHEAYLGDDTTPKKRALAAIMGNFGVLAAAISDSFAMLTDRIDVAIHARAGLAWPPTPEIQAQIRKWDRVMLATEWRDLMGCPPPYEFEEKPIPVVVEPHASWPEARREFESWCNDLVPGAKR